MNQQIDYTQEFGKKTFRIFISSTFADMHAERDYLREHAFRRLAAELSRLGYGFLPIDLRGSVEEGFADPERNVFHMCLRRVEDCRPRFLGLVGDRYGWICYDDSVEAKSTPEAERLRRVISDVCNESGLFPAEIKDRSMTHVEIAYGLKQMQRDCCFFYLRAPLPYASMGKDAELYRENPARQEELKRWLKAEFSALPGHVSEYPAAWSGEGQPLSGLEELDRRVYDDLYASLTAEIAALSAAERSEEADPQRDFSAARLTGSLPRKDIVRQLCDFALQTPGGTLLLSAPDGSGKSTVMAQLENALQATGVTVLSHFSALNQDFSDIRNLYLNFMRKLHRQSGVSGLPAGVIPDEEGKLRGLFTEQLAKAAGSRRVALLVDSVDQLQTVLVNPLSLFGALPQNAVLIASAAPGLQPPAGMQLTRVTLSNSGLSDAELDSVITACAERYGKTLDSALRAFCVSKVRKAGCSLLYARILVDYLMRMTGADYRAYSGADAHRKWMEAAIADMPLDPAGAFMQVLARARAAYGGQYVMSLASLLACSPGGLRTAELKAAMAALDIEISDITLYELRDALFGYLRRDLDCDWWTLEYPELSRGVTQDYDREQLAALHGAIVEASIGLDVRDGFKAREYLYHCFMAGDAENAALYLCDAKFGMQQACRTEQRGLRSILQQPGGLAWVLRVLDRFTTPLRPGYMLDTLLRETRAPQAALSPELRLTLAQKLGEISQIRGHRRDIPVAGPRYCQEQRRYCFALLIQSELHQLIDQPEQQTKVLERARAEIATLKKDFPEDKNTEELFMAISSAAGDAGSALDTALARLQAAPGNPFSWHDASVAHLSRANQRQGSDPAGALSDYDESVRLMERAMELSQHTIFTQDLLWERDMANAYASRAKANERSAPQKARADYCKAVDYLSAKLSAHPEDVRLVRVYANAALGAGLLASGNEALSLYQKGAAAFDGLGNEALFDNDMFNLYSALCAKGAELCGGAGSAAGVIEWYTRLERAVCSRFDERVKNPASASLQNIFLTLANAWQMTGQREKAEAYSRRAAAIAKLMEGR